MLAKEIIKSARYILSDSAADRWTDERLLSLLSDGIKDLARDTILLINTAYVKLRNNQVDYDLSEFAVKIIRIEYNDLPLKPITHAEMDRRYSYGWNTSTGSQVQAYVIDKQAEANFKLYPRLQNAVQDNIDFGGPYGIITGINYSNLPLIVSGDFGDLGGVDKEGFIKVYYIRKHEAITDMLDEVYISEIAKEPLSHYIAGRAFRDSQDTQNRILGNEELDMYAGQIAAYSLEKAKNFTGTSYTVPYRPLGV